MHDSCRRAVGLAVGLATIVALAWPVAATAMGGPAELPIAENSEQVRRLSANALELGHGKKLPFAWGMSVEQSGARPGSASRLCFTVGLIGPLAPTPAGTLSGQEGIERGCRPSASTEGVVVTSATQHGSLELPSFGGTVYWPSFDIGVAAYPPSVTETRLFFAGGGPPRTYQLRRLAPKFALAGSEPFRYRAFAVYGCVTEVEGFANGKLVARAPQQGCEFNQP